MRCVAAGGPASATARQSDLAQGKGDGALPLTNQIGPAAIAAATSTPEGLPWNTLSQAFAAFRTSASLAWMPSAAQAARAMATAIAADAPSPTPAGKSSVTSTATAERFPLAACRCSSSARNARALSLESRAATWLTPKLRRDSGTPALAQARAPLSIPAAMAGQP